MPGPGPRCGSTGPAKAPSRCGCRGAWRSVCAGTHHSKNSTQSIPLSCAFGSFIQALEEDKIKQDATSEEKKMAVTKEPPEAHAPAATVSTTGTITVAAAATSAPAPKAKPAAAAVRKPSKGGGGCCSSGTRV